MLKHFLDVSVDDRQLSCWMTSKSLEVSHVVAGFDAVSRDIGSTDIELRSREDLRPRLDELLRASALLGGQVVWQPLNQVPNVLITTNRGLVDGCSRLAVAILSTPIRESRC